MQNGFSTEMQAATDETQQPPYREAPAEENEVEENEEE